MNLVVLCQGCGAVYRVMQQEGGTDVASLVGDKSPFWKTGYECPKCHSLSPGQDEAYIPRAFHTSNMVDLTAEEFYAALNGLGLPDERKTGLANVEALLLAHRVVKVVGRDVPNTGRCVIEQLVLEDGTTLHLGSSTHGAVVYRAVPKFSYAKRVEDGSSVREGP